MCGTNLASHGPHGDWVVVGGVRSGARWVDPAEFVHIVVDEGSSCVKKLPFQSNLVRPRGCG